MVLPLQRFASVSHFRSIRPSAHSIGICRANSFCCSVLSSTHHHIQAGKSRVNGAPIFLDTLQWRPKNRNRLRLVKKITILSRNSTCQERLPRHRNRSGAVLFPALSAGQGIRHASVEPKSRLPPVDSLPFESTVAGGLRSPRRGPLPPAPRVP